MAENNQLRRELGTAKGNAVVGLRPKVLIFFPIFLRAVEHAIALSLVIRDNIRMPVSSIQAWMRAQGHTPITVMRNNIYRKHR